MANDSPVGRYMDMDLDRVAREHPDSKFQLGVSGTTRPGRPKATMRIAFVLDKSDRMLPGRVKTSALSDKIQDKFRGIPNVKMQRTGFKYDSPFENQAIIVELRGENLPVQDSQIHKAANAITRHYPPDMDIGIRTVVIDTE